MKEFDKWNKLRGIDFRIRFSPPKQFEVYIEQEREDAWEAALEWVLSEEVKDDGGEYIDISWKINEELNAKT